MSNEKNRCGWLGDIKGWNVLPSYFWWIYFEINHDIRIPMKNKQYDSWVSYPAGFFYGKLKWRRRKYQADQGQKSCPRFQGWSLRRHCWNCGFLRVWYIPSCFQESGFTSWCFCPSNFWWMILRQRIRILSTIKPVEIRKKNLRCVFSNPRNRCKSSDKQPMNWRRISGN